MAEERGESEVGAFNCAWALELIERYVTALEDDAVEYGGGLEPKWMPIWWEGNPKPDPQAPFSDAFAYDCHGEKLRLGEDFAVDPPDYYPCDWCWPGSPVRYRAFAFRNAAGQGEPVRAKVVTFGEVMADDCGGCALCHDADSVWKHELELDDEGRYEQDASSLEELKSIDFDGWDCSDSIYLGAALSDFCAGFDVPFIPNEEVGGSFEVYSSDDYVIDGIVAYGDEQRSGIEKLIDLLDRWLAVRRRALDKRRPIPLATEPSAWERVRWGFKSSIEDYDLVSPEELSDTEQKAVSLYVKNPYWPKWVGDNSYLPDDVKREIERESKPSASYEWLFGNSAPVAAANDRRVEARRKIKSGVASLKEALAAIDEGVEELGDDARDQLGYPLNRVLVERGIEGLEKAIENLDCSE